MQKIKNAEANFSVLISFKSDLSFYIHAGVSYSQMYEQQNIKECMETRIEMKFASIKENKYGNEAESKLASSLF